MPFGKTLWINLFSKSFFSIPKICYKFDPVLDPNNDIMLGIKQIKFVGLPLAVEILQTYQTPPQSGG